MATPPKFGYVYAIGKGWNLHVQSIARDEELIERMRDTAQAFWEKVSEKKEDWRKFRY